MTPQEFFKNDLFAENAGVDGLYTRDVVDEGHEGSDGGIEL